MSEWADYQKWLDEERDFEQADRVRWTNPPVPASPAHTPGKPEPGPRGDAAGTRPHRHAGGNPALVPDLTGFRFPSSIRGRFVLWQNQANCHPWEIAVATDADGQRRCRWCVYGDDAT